MLHLINDDIHGVRVPEEDRVELRGPFLGEVDGVETVCSVPRCPILVVLSLVLVPNGVRS